MYKRVDDLRMQELLEHPGVVDALGTIAQGDSRPNIKPDNDVDWILPHNLGAVDAGCIPPGMSDHPLIWADIRVTSKNQ